MTGEQVISLLKAACEAAGSQSAWGKGVGLSAQYVSDVLNGKRPPGDAILIALGLRRIVLYEPAQDQATAKSVEDMIRQEEQIKAVALANECIKEGQRLPAALTQDFYEGWEAACEFVALRLSGKSL